MRFFGFLFGLVLGMLTITVTFFALGPIPVLTFKVTIFAGAIFAVFLWIAVLISYAIAVFLANFPGATTFVSVLAFLAVVVFLIVAIVVLYVFEDAVPGPILPVLVLVPLLTYLSWAAGKFLVTFVTYVLASLSARAPILEPEHFARGVNTGLNTAYAVLFGSFVYCAIFDFALPLPLAVAGSLLMAFLIFVTQFGGLLASTDPVMKGVVGWTLPLNPPAWFVSGLGALLYGIGVSLHWISAISPAATIFALRRTYVLEPFGSIVTIGGLPANLNSLGGGAYNLGPFILVFGGPGSAATELHEAGHGLGLGVFGGHFHFIGWFEEILGFGGALPGGGASAYAELLADSNRAGGGPAAMWN